MNMLVVIKTKYASIEQRFEHRIDAAAFLKAKLESIDDIVSYEIRPLKD